LRALEAGTRGGDLKVPEIAVHRDFAAMFGGSARGRVDKSIGKAMGGQGSGRFCLGGGGGKSICAVGVAHQLGGDGGALLVGRGIALQGCAVFHAEFGMGLPGGLHIGGREAQTGQQRFQIRKTLLGRGFLFHKAGEVFVLSGRVVTAQEDVLPLLHLGFNTHLGAPGEFHGGTGGIAELNGFLMAGRRPSEAAIANSPHQQGDHRDG